MALVSLPSAKDAKTVEEVIDVVENMRKQVEFLLMNVQTDNINGVISADKIAIGVGSSFENGYDPSQLPHEILLSNENQSFNTDYAGKTVASITISTDILIYKGGKQIAGTIGTLALKDLNGNAISTTGVTLSKVNPTSTVTGSVTMTIASGTTLSVDSGYVDIPITADSNSYSKKLTWSKAKSGYTPVKGTDYFDGQPGQTGTSSYLWIRYSQNADGSSMTTDPTGAKYIGIATTAVNSAPAVNTSYTWSLIKGQDGTPGETGPNGQTSYLHIKYSDDGGTTFTGNNGENVGIYIGTYVDFTAADSNTPNAYTWNKVKGDDAKYVIVTGNQVFKYAAGAGTPSPTTITLTAAAYGVTPSYQWQYWDGAAWTNLAKAGNNTATYTVAYNDTEFGIPSSVRYRCLVNNLYSDEITLVKLYDGSTGGSGAPGTPALTCFLTNETTAIPTDQNGGNGNYVGSGTQIYLYEGTNPLDYDGIGTANGKWKISAAGTNITASTSFTDSGNYVTVGDHSAITQDTASVLYTITGKRADGTAISFTKTQTLSRAKAGTNAKVADIVASSHTFKSSDGGTTYTPSNITLTPALQNVTYSKWQYSTNGGSTWTDVVSGSNGITISGGVLTIQNNSALFTSTISSVAFKLITSDAATYDTLTLLKIFDVKGTYIDQNGVYTGTISFNQGYGGTLTLGGSSNGNGKMVVLDDSGNQIANLDASQGGFSNLYVADLDSPTVPSYSNQDLTFYVASKADAAAGVATPDDSNSGTGFGAPLRTINEAIRRIPKYYDGNAKIWLAYNHSFNETVEVDGFAGVGQINIDGQSMVTTITGRINVMRNSVGVTVTNFTLNTTDSYSAINWTFSDGWVTGVKINGLSGNGTNYGIDNIHGGYCEISNCQVYSVKYCATARYGGITFLSGCSGYGSVAGQYGFGGWVVGESTAFAGATNNVTGAGGSVGSSWSSYNSGSYVAPAAPATTGTWTNNASDSYHDGVSAWDNTTNDVLQGQYGSAGPYRGCWFFGTAPSTAVTGKTISQIRVYLTRANSSGNSASVNAVIRPHGYATQPAGQPSYLGTSYTVGFKWGEAKWVTLPTSFHSYFQNGSAKGIGIQTGTNSDYMRFTTSAKIEITYA